MRPEGWLNADGKLIMLEKCVRTVPYGFLGVLYGVYLSQLGFNDFSVGAVLTVTVLTSALYTFAISFIADRFGRKRTLIVFAFMDFVAGGLLFASSAWWAPVLAGIVGNMTVGAGEVGPFLSLEQAILPKVTDVKHRTVTFSIYNLIGYASSAGGALLAGLPQYLGAGAGAYRPLFVTYLLSGLVGGCIYSRMSKSVELTPNAAHQKWQILSDKSKPIVKKLAGFFAIDAFGGGFIGQSILAYYFYRRFALQFSSLGLIFAATQVITAVSFLVAERVARRIGLLNTMVFTHLPSNVFLALVALAPTPVSAVSLLLCRQSLSQMDVPARQSYVMAIVDEADRTPAAGFTNVSRSVAQSLSPSLAGYAMSNLWIGTPVMAAGLLKIVYDLMIYGSFRKIKPPEETAKTR